MCLHQYFSYSLCDHNSEIKLIPCNRDPVSNGSEPICPRQKKIRTHLADQVCDSCLLTNDDLLDSLAPTHEIYQANSLDLEAIFADRQSQYSKVILARGVQYMKAHGACKRDSLIASQDGEILSVKVLNALKVIFWWLDSYFWTSLKTGVRLSPEERMLIVQLRAAIQHQMVVGTFLFLFPLTRRQYLVRQCLTAVETPIAEMDEEDQICPISQLKFGDETEHGVDRPVTIKSCGNKHTFGNQALLTWLDSATTCPMCRTEVLPLFANRCLFRDFMFYTSERKSSRLFPEHLRILKVMLGCEARELLVHLPLIPTPWDMKEYNQRLEVDAIARGEMVWGEEFSTFHEDVDAEDHEGGEGCNCDIEYA